MGFSELYGFLRIAFGFTLVDKHVVFSATDNEPCSSVFNSLRGKIDFVDNNKIEVSSDMSIKIDGINYTKFTLKPRHKGFGTKALILSKIAVYVYPNHGVLNDSNKSIGIAFVQLSKEQ